MGHIEYNLRRSRRRTLGIYVKGANVEVRAPMNTPKKEIEAFLRAKTQWIEKHLESQRETELFREGFRFEQGTLLLCRGGEYPLMLNDGNEAGFNGEFFYAPKNLTQIRLKEALTVVYKLLSRGYLPQRTAELAEALKLKPAAVKVSSAKTRWGSCSGKNSINLSWRLIMAGDDCIDYVIIHELAHIVEHNHSQRFWAIVKKAMPGCEKQRKELKLLARRMLAEGW